MFAFEPHTYRLSSNVRFCRFVGVFSGFVSVAERSTEWMGWVGPCSLADPGGGKRGKKLIMRGKNMFLPPPN